MGGRIRQGPLVTSTFGAFNDRGQEVSLGVAGAGTWLGNESGGSPSQGLVREGCMTPRVSGSLRVGCLGSRR